MKIKGGIVLLVFMMTSAAMTGEGLSQQQGCRQVCTKEAVKCLKYGKDCVRHVNECAHYRNQCVSYNRYGGCLRYQQVCAQYRQVCAQYQQVCVQQQKVCAKYETVCPSAKKPSGKMSCRECSVNRDRCFAGCNSLRNLIDQSNCVNRCNGAYSCISGYDCQ